MALSDFVVVNVSISAAGAITRQGFNAGLIAAYHNVYPDRVRVYSTTGGLAQMVTDGFSVNSPAYKAAAAYSAAPNPAPTFAIGRRALPPLQQIQLTFVDGTVNDKYSFTLVGSDGVVHALSYVNAPNPGPALTGGTALTGTATVTSGSNAVIFSATQTLAAGTLLTFSSQAGVSYAVATATNTSTSATLTAIYTGASSTSATATPGATTAVTNGSPNVTFSVAQTLAKGTLLTFAAQPGVYYALSAAITAATAGVLTAAYQGTTAAASQTQALAPLAGTFAATNPSPNVPTTSSQVGVVNPGDTIVFSSQPGTTYGVAAVSGTAVTLTSPYTGTTAGTANAADVCTSSTAATFMQASISALSNVGTASLATNVITLSRVDGLLTDVQNWLNNGFASIQLADITADPGIATDLAAMQQANNGAWYGLVLDSNSDAEVKAAAAFTETSGVGGKFGFFNSSTFGNTQTTVTTDIFSVMKGLTYKRSFTVQNNTQLLCYAGAATCGQALGLNPGSYTLAYKSLPNVPADSDTTLPEGQALALNTMTPLTPGSGGKNGNYYKTVAGQNWLNPGTTPSGQFADLTIGIDWLQVNMQADVAAVLASLPKVPFTDFGIGLIRDAIDARLRLASSPTFGLVLPDGQDPKRPISVVVPKASAVSTTDRQNRNVPNITWSAGLAGAIQTATITGSLQP